MEIHKDTNIKPMGISESILFFGIPTLYLFLITHFFVPIMNDFTGLPRVICWYINSVTDVFILLFFFSLVFYKAEGNQFTFQGVKERFRFRKMSLRDFWWVMGLIVITGVLTGLMIFLAKQINPDFSCQPSFMDNAPFNKDERWIIWAWLPFFLINVLGVEFFFRGYVFPRQEKHFGNRTWLIHGIFWLFFHVSFGLSFLITLIPVVFITSYAVQKTGNTYVSILIHGLINAFGFLSVFLGLM